MSDLLFSGCASLILTPQIDAVAPHYDLDELQLQRASNSPGHDPGSRNDNPIQRVVPISSGCTADASCPQVDTLRHGDDDARGAASIDIYNNVRTSFQAFIQTLLFPQSMVRNNFHSPRRRRL